MTLYVIEIKVGDNEWKRVGRYYRDKECCKSWIGFVKKAWYARHARVATVQVQDATDGSERRMEP